MAPNRFRVGKLLPSESAWPQCRKHPVAELLPTPNEKNPGKTGVFGFLERVAWSTATGIRTPVSGLRIRRPSPLDDSGEGEGILARRGAGAFRGMASGGAARFTNVCSIYQEAGDRPEIDRLGGPAGVLELVDSIGSEPVARKRVWVRFPPPAFSHAP